jgi:hypothetical protein
LVSPTGQAMVWWMSECADDAPRPGPEGRVPALKGSCCAIRRHRHRAAIFPALFISGTARIIVHQVIHGVPLGLAFTCLLAAIPGALVAAPFAMVLMAWTGSILLCSPRPLRPAG